MQYIDNVLHKGGTVSAKDTYVVRSKYKSGGEEMLTEYRLSKYDHGERIDPLGKTPALLTEIESGMGSGEHMLPNLEDLVRLGRIAQALLDGREPARKNYDAKEEDTEQ